MGDNALELLIKIETQGKQALDELTAATRKQGQEDQQQNAAAVQAHEARGRALASQLRAHKDVGSAAYQSGMQALQAISPVVAEELKLTRASEQAAAALMKPAEAIPEWKRLEEQVRAVTGAQDKAAHGETSKHGLPDLGGLGDAIKDAFGPLGEAGGMLEGFFSKLASAPGLFAGFVTGLGAVAAGMLSLAHGAAEAAHEQVNMAERTGLTVQEVSGFSRAAKVMGVDIHGMVTSMRTLSQALSDNGEEGKKGKQVLSELGVTAYNATGEMKPMGQLWMEIAEGLSGIENPAKRADAAIKLFGRGGLELLPLLRGNFKELVSEVQQFGLQSDVSAQQAAHFQEELNKLSVAWGALKTSMGRKAIGVIEVLFPGMQSNSTRIAELTAKLNATSPTWIHTFYRKQLQDEIDKLKSQDSDAQLSAYTGPKSENRFEHRTTTQAIAENDKAVAAMTAAGSTAEDKVKGLQADVDKLVASLKTGVFPEVNAGAIAEINAKRMQISALEAQMKAQKELTQVQQAADRAVQAAHLAELSGLAKLRAERDIAIDQTRKLGAAGQKAAAEFRQAFDVGGKLEALKELAKVQAELRKGDDDKGRLPADIVKDKSALSEQVGALYMQVQKGTLPLDDLFRKLSDINGQVQDIFIRQNWFEHQEKYANEFTAGLRKKMADDKAALADLKKEWDEGVAPEKGRLQGEQQSIRDAAARQIKLAEVQSMPGDEYSTFNTVTAIKEKAAQDEYDRAMKLAQLHLDDSDRQKDEAKALEALKRGIDDAELDRTIKIYETRKKELEEFRASAGRIFDAITSKGMAGLGDYFKGMMQTFEKTVFQNVATEVFKNLQGQFKLGDAIGGQTQKDAQGNTELTALGRILKGTPLGVDPAKLAQEASMNATKAQTSATVDLKQATVNLTAAMKTRAGTAKSVAAGASDDSKVQGDGDDLIDSVDSALGGDTGRSVSSSASTLASILGKTAILGAAAFGVYSGIQQGGARGAVTAIGSAAGAAAMYDQEPISKSILVGVSLVSGLISSMFGNAAQQFDQAQTAVLANAKYIAPTALNRTVGLTGADVDYDYQGRLRSTDGNKPTTVQFNMNITAMDAKSVMDRSPDIANAVQKELRLGHPVALGIQQAILGT